MASQRAGRRLAREILRPGTARRIKSSGVWSFETSPSEPVAQPLSDDPLPRGSTRPSHPSLDPTDPSLRPTTSGSSVSWLPLVAHTLHHDPPSPVGGFAHQLHRARVSSNSPVVASATAFRPVGGVHLGRQPRFFSSPGLRGGESNPTSKEGKTRNKNEAQRKGGTKAEFKFPEVDAEAVMKALEEAARLKDGTPLEAEERKKINGYLRHFHISGWSADQALAIYINSGFFPTAAAKFRKFVLRAVEGDLKSILLAAGDPGHASDEFLFPIFAEFCFNNFAAEIKSYRDLVNSADMTKPHTWYPYARALKRTVVYHMGPTNSGKTHQALERFKVARSGIYCGPLRLLAMEVFDRVNADGVYCNLITGQERKEMPFAQHTACTIEMANLFKPVDVVIIDEIQMINDEYRGWAWTRALLGCQAAEIHVCGDPSALGMLQSLCQATGDELVCNSYSRFAPLTVDQTSLEGDLSRVQPGDCIVAFSRRDIFDIKRQIEVLAQQRCCVVYGALPPETRRQQALLFNQEDSGFDVLVASDAVGMGLNLNIRRIVFFTLSKFNGDAKVPIPAPMVKQIAGRAGRRGSMYEQGVATCLNPGDIPQLISCLQEEVKPITEVGLFPVFEQVELFASQLPEMTFSQLLNRFVTTSRVDGQFFICRTDNILKVANMLDKVKGLSLQDRFQFCFAPANTQDPAVMANLLQYAQSFAQEEPVALNLPRSSVFTAAAYAAAKARAAAFPGSRPPSNFSFDLMALEGRHQVASMYLWLAQHFPREKFPDVELAGTMAKGVAQELAQSLLKPMEEEQGRGQGRMANLRHGGRESGRDRPRAQQAGRRESLQRSAIRGKESVEEGGVGGWVAVGA